LLANASFYSYVPEKHQTLGLSHYTHATSPLRRFPDFYNQLCFKNWIIGNRVDKPDIFELNRKKYLFKKFYRNYNLMKIMNEKQIVTKIISINLEKKTGTILYENNLLKFHIVPKIYKEFVEITIENNYLIIKDNRNIKDTKDTKINVKEEVLFEIIHYDKLELKDRICPQIHAIKDCFISN
jgi:exoribonuclease II